MIFIISMLTTRRSRISTMMSSKRHIIMQHKKEHLVVSITHVPSSFQSDLIFWRKIRIIPSCMVMETLFGINGPFSFFTRVIIRDACFLFTQQFKNIIMRINVWCIAEKTLKLSLLCKKLSLYGSKR